MWSDSEANTDETMRKAKKKRDWMVGCIETARVRVDLTVRGERGLYFPLLVFASLRSAMDGERESRVRETVCESGLDDGLDGKLQLYPNKISLVVPVDYSKYILVLVENF